MNFPQKSGSITFYHLQPLKFIQKIGITNKPILKKLLTKGRADEQTNEGEVIGTIQ